MKKLVIGLVVFWIFGCSFNVPPEAIERALNVCNRNDGTKHILIDSFFYSFHGVLHMAQCNDGAKFYYPADEQN